MARLAVTFCLLAVLVAANGVAARKMLAAGFAQSTSTATGPATLVSSGASSTSTPLTSVNTATGTALAPNGGTANVNLNTFSTNGFSTASSALNGFAAGSQFAGVTGATTTTAGLYSPTTATAQGNILALAQGNPSFSSTSALLNSFGG
ncbi:hypothetical protein N2152v2_007210 [Parachlorella kessleri]